MKVYVFTSYAESSNEIITNVFSTEEKALEKMTEYRNEINEDEDDEIMCDSQYYVSYVSGCGYVNTFSYKECEIDVE